MLDALKFAFEILIVGALAIPWVALLYRVLHNEIGTNFNFDLSFVPKGARSAAELALVLAFAYLLGSAVSRFSRDFFNDELWEPLPTEDRIRDSVYFDELCSEHWMLFTSLSEPIHLRPPGDFCGPASRKDLNATMPAEVPGDSVFTKGTGTAPTRELSVTASAGELSVTASTRALSVTGSSVTGPAQKADAAAQKNHIPRSERDPCRDDPGKDPNAPHAKGDPNRRFLKLTDLDACQLDQFDQRVQELFQLEDSELLLQGVDRVERLKQYFDQITILRGAAFNSFVLFALALFGIFAMVRERLAGPWRMLPFLAPLGAAIFTLNSLWNHCLVSSQSIYSDPPLAETVIFLLCLVGSAIIWRPAKGVPYFKICTIATVLMVASFGGWWWTEVMYDLQVIHSLSEVEYRGERLGNPEQGVMKLDAPPESLPAQQVPDHTAPVPNQPK